MLICPKCKQKLNIENELFIQNKSYKCNNNHCYDISKEGYTNFLDSKTGSGDNSILINARENFLNKGYYNKLRESICNLIKKYQPDLVLRHQYARRNGFCRPGIRTDSAVG